MANYIETRIRYDKVQENGAVKTVTERYLVDAETFTEAEARIIKEQTPYLSGEFSVSAIAKTKYVEVVRSNSSDGKWYNCAVAFITIDEKSGVEKSKTTHMLFEAESLEAALKSLLNHLKDTMSDFTVTGVTETAILEVYEC